MMIIQLILLRNLKVHRRHNKIPASDPILNRFNTLCCFLNLIHCLGFIKITKFPY